MTQSLPDKGRGHAGTQPPVDWEAVAQSPQFRELVVARRRFVLPATIFFLAWYVGFILLAGDAPDFMKRSVDEGLTVGYCLALTQFVMVGVLGSPTCAAPSGSMTRSPGGRGSRTAPRGVRRRSPGRAGRRAAHRPEATR